jgi:hypothetical protein
MIAPYWADVDVRMVGGVCMGGAGTSEPGDLGCMDPADNGVWWQLELGRMVVTWDRVGYFGCNVDNRMSFQLVLTEALYCGVPGDFDVEFRYYQCEWETGDASGGTGGFGGTQAQVGFDAGNSVDFVSVPGSRMAGISTVMCDMSNVEDPGVWRFRIRRGAVECVDAGEECNTGMLGACSAGRTRCVGADVECQPLVTANDEGCDGIDNNCDGMTDEGDDLCPGTQICDRGVCIDGCFEGGCPTGQTCSADGVCLDDLCVDVDCPEGERCIAGECVSVCDGVVCPPGRTCLAGRCIDACAGIECGFCEVCENGACEPHCLVATCGAGEACEETGECVEEPCLGVRCGPGRVCRAGVCADACDGVLCPMAEECRHGECVAMGSGMPDAGPGGDGGPGVDGGPGADGGGADAGGGTTRTEEDGCGCSVPGARGPAGSALLLFFFLPLAILSFRVVRRRR